MIKRRIFWLLWLAAAVVLYFFENNTGTRIVLASSLLIPLFSIFCAMLFAEHIHFEISTPKSVQKGEAFSLIGKVRGSFLSAACLPFASVFIENPLTGETVSSERFPFDRENDIRFRSDHCGSLVIRLKDCAVEDRFGLFRFPVPENAFEEKRVMVYPELSAVRIDRGHDSEGNEEVGSVSVGPGGVDLSSYSGIRDYVPGDPVRQIHWKLSVKTDRLLLRESEKETSSGLMLWLETSADVLDPEKMDRAAVRLLSVSRSLCEACCPHQVSWFDHAREQTEEAFVASPPDFDQMEKQLLSAKSGSGRNVGIDDFGPEVCVVRFDPTDGDASLTETAVFSVR